MEQVVEGHIFGHWNALPAQHRFMIFAALAFLAALAAGASDSQFATPFWVIATLGGAFMCIYAFPSVWRYLVHLGLIYAVLAPGTVLYLIYRADAPFLIGWAAVLHGIGIFVTFHLVRDVVMHRRAYHMAALKEGKEAPYVPVGLWLLALIAYFILVDVSMVGYSRWVLDEDSLGLYYGSEVVLVGLLMYILYVPERAFGGKGADFVPRVSLGDITSETRKVAKRLVQRKKRERPAARSARAAVDAMRPKVLAGGTLECPACGADLAIDVRRCPECYRGNEFAWCPVSEHYIQPCPSCGKPTVYGEGKCSHCGKALGLDYKCPSCLKSNPLSRWERA